MPELPEVETTRKGLEPLITNQKILAVHIYKKKLRWEIPSLLKETLENQTIKKQKVTLTDTQNQTEHLLGTTATFGNEKASADT